MKKGYVSALVFFIVLDQFLKRFVSWPYTCNQGIAFGLPVKLWVVGVVILLLACFIGLLIRKDLLVKENKALLLIFFGALSNISDRFVYGCVVDYISIGDFFPYFNIADIMISLGGVWFVFGVMNDKR